MPEDTVVAAWADGHEAGCRRQPLQGNASLAGTAPFKAWQAGWRGAQGTGRPGDRPPPQQAP